MKILVCASFNIMFEFYLNKLVMSVIEIKVMIELRHPFFELVILRSLTEEKFIFFTFSSGTHVDKNGFDVRNYVKSL